MCLERDTQRKAWENPNHKRVTMSTFGNKRKIIGDRVTEAGKPERKKGN
jgi:hypothetical protein